MRLPTGPGSTMPPVAIYTSGYGSRPAKTTSSIPISRLSALFHPRGECLAELADFGRYHECAVWLLRIIAEVVLMIVLGDIERFRRTQFCNDGLGEIVRQFRDDLFRNPALLVAMKEN